MKSTTARTGWTRTPSGNSCPLRPTSAEAYWSRWRSREDVQRQIQGAWRVVGCYDGQGHMVGFARALSDGVALAYLADVYVLEDHRGRGLGRALLQEMIEDGPGKGFRWLLHTADAHGLYRQFGFTAPDATIMERASRRPTSADRPGARPLVPPLLGQSRGAWGLVSRAAPGASSSGGLVPVPAGTAANAPRGVTRRRAWGTVARIGEARPAGTGSGRPDPAGSGKARPRGDRIRQGQTAGIRQARSREKAEAPEPLRSGEMRRDRVGDSVAVDGGGLLV